MISSNVFERWLISRIDMPTPGSDEQIALRLLEHFDRQHRRAGGEIEDSFVVVMAMSS